MELDTDSDTDSQECKTTQETRSSHSFRHVFEPYFKRIFSSNGFIKHMNQRCRANNDSTSYILLCEAIKRNDTRNALLLLSSYCKASTENPDPSKDIPLHLATLSGNVEIVEALLSEGARVNVSFPDRKKPLHLICDKKSTPIPDEISRLAIARLFLKYGANINAVEKVNKDTPLILAVRSKYLELTKFLLNNGSDRHYSNKYSETALHIAFSENAGIELIELLYDDEFDLLQTDDNDCTLFSYAVNNLITSEFGPFNEALKPILFLLKHGVSVNSVLDKCGNKILHMICQNHAVRTMKIFLDYGAEVDSKNIDGKTPLHFCAEKQSLSFIELLLSYGADVNMLANNGQSVIYFAAANEHYTVLKYLLKYGLDINAKGNDGFFTPLFNAVWNNRYDNVKLLLEWHANVNERIINNQIVLHLAVDQKHVDLIDILLEHGSDINLLDDYGNTALSISLYQVSESINSNNSECVQRILTKHTAKLYLSGKHISDQSLRVMNHSHFKNFFEDCIRELNLMKNTEIIDNITFFDVLTNSRMKLFTLMRNSNFMSALDNIKFNENFPIYCDNLEQNFHFTAMRLILLKSAGETLIKIVQNIDKSWVDFHLPSLVVEHISSYLNLTDLEDLSSVFS